LYCPPSIIIVDEEKKLELAKAIKLLRVEDAEKKKKNLKPIYKQMSLLDSTYRSLSNIVCAFLPQISNVRIKSYKGETSPPTVADSEHAHVRKIINKIVNFVTSMSNHKISETCVMSFCNLNGYYSTGIRFANILNQNRYNLYLIQAIIHI